MYIALKYGGWHGQAQKVKNQIQIGQEDHVSSLENHEEVTTLYGNLKEGMASTQGQQKEVTKSMYQPLEGSHRLGPMPRGKTRSLANHKEGTKEV